MEYLVITEQLNNYFFPFVKYENIELSSAYIIENKYNEFLMRIYRKLNLDFSKYIATCNLKKEYDSITVFDCSCDFKNMPYLKGKNKKVNLFIWNTVDDFLGRLRKSKRDVGIDYVKKSFDDVYSFDKKDCEKYALIYYPTLFSRNLVLNDVEKEYDLVFLGAEKGRRKLLSDIYSEINMYGYKQRYHIFKEHAEYISSNGLTVSSKRISYTEYLKWVEKSRAILDVPQANQVGFTLRVMESIFLNKKLITTCVDIMQYKIYNPTNIFIVGYDDYSKLADFFESDYEPIPDEILDKYDFKNWIPNMLNNNIENGI